MIQTRARTSRWASLDNPLLDRISQTFCTMSQLAMNAWSVFLNPVFAFLQRDSLRKMSSPRTPYRPSELRRELNIHSVCLFSNIQHHALSCSVMFVNRNGPSIDPLYWKVSRAAFSTNHLALDRPSWERFSAFHDISPENVECTYHKWRTQNLALPIYTRLRNSNCEELSFYPVRSFLMSPETYRWVRNNQCVCIRLTCVVTYLFLGRREVVLAFQISDVPGANQWLWSKIEHGKLTHGGYSAWSLFRN